MSYKVCPICGTPAFPNATLCSTCGTTLTDVDLVKRDDKPEKPSATYDHRYGEADLLEGELRHQGQIFLFGAGLVVLLLICGLGLFYGGTRLLSATQDTPTPINSPFPTLQTTNEDAVVASATRQELVLPTVTPAPPTATFTPTQGPCERQVQSGDDIISLAYSCGHRSQDVLPLILEMNDLSAPEQLQAGQTLLIPWPTPAEATFEVDPTSAAMLDVDGRADSNSMATVDAFFAAQNSTGLPMSYSSAFATPTLLPGVTWHIVQANESMIGIAYQYGTNAETLSQLNPEIPFSQCDFQYDTGGERCMVFLQVGQQIRVPAPLPTATLSPTFSGSETATFTPTPTYNAPSALSPGNRAMFGRNDMVTLRWVASGSLSAGEAYRVTVENLTTLTVHTADTSELFYIVPGDWQGRDARRHQYRWSVSIIRLDAPENLTFTTEARLFTWEGRGES